MTKAALLLDELNLDADKVAEEDVASLLKPLFKLAKVLDVPSDVAKGFSITSNGLRLHWVLRRLALERFGLPERSSPFLAACKEASLGGLVDFAEAACRDYHPRDGVEAEPKVKCLTTPADADSLRAMALTRLRHASKTQELSANPVLPSLLYRWREFAAWCTHSLLTPHNFPPPEPEVRATALAERDRGPKTWIAIIEGDVPPWRDAWQHQQLQFGATSAGAFHANAPILSLIAR